MDSQRKTVTDDKIVSLSHPRSLFALVSLSLSKQQLERNITNVMAALHCVSRKNKHKSEKHKEKMVWFCLFLGHLA